MAIRAVNRKREERYRAEVRLGSEARSRVAVRAQ